MNKINGIFTIEVILIILINIFIESFGISTESEIYFLTSISTTIAVFVIVGGIVYRIAKFIGKRKRSDLKGGIFFEEKDNETRKDYKYIRTHHVITENDYSLSKIQATDEYFDEDRFLIFVKNIFIKQQDAWSKFDFETLKKIETEELYKNHSNLLNEIKKNNQINIVDKISVHSANIYTFKQIENKEYIDVILNASKIEYLMCTETNEILNGDKEFKSNTTYLLQFERKKGTKTQKDLEKRKRSVKIAKGTPCPNCGATLDQKLYGWCEYCMGTNKKEELWALNQMEIFEN